MNLFHVYNKKKNCWEGTKWYNVIVSTWEEVGDGKVSLRR